MAYEDLPKINPSHVQSAESVRALEGYFCLPDFIARSQNPDYGKDYEVELCENQNPLNISFSVQLKSVGKLAVLDDGLNISFSIETSRLNYLSKSPCGAMLVVYDLNTKRTFYEWIHVILAQLDASKETWRGQDSVGVHISMGNMLGKESLIAIHSDVKQRHAQIMSGASKEGLPFVSGTAKASNILEEIKKNYAELLDSLLKYGHAWISQGYSKTVLAAYSSVPSVQWQNSARHLLTISHAYESSGMPLQALSNVVAALAGNLDACLDDGDKILAENIRLSAKRMLGQIDADSYYAEIARVVNAYSEHASVAPLRLELITRELRRGSDSPERIDGLVESAKSIHAKAASGVPDGDVWGWAMQRMLAIIEFQAADRHLIRSATQIKISDKVGYPISQAGRLEMAKRPMALKSSALERFRILMESADKVKRADLIAMCLVDIVLHSIAFLITSRGLIREAVTQNLDIKWDSSEIQQCVKQIDLAISIYEKSGPLARYINALRLKAEILNAVGKRSEAEELLKTLRAKGEALGIPANSFQVTDMPVAHTDEEANAAIINASDETLMRFSRTFADSVGLPADRIANVYKGFLAMRRISREHSGWCKHIELLENLQHTQSLNTFYAIDPDRHGKCTRFGHESKIGSSDLESIISAFKSAYCVTCKHREIG